MRAKPIAIAFLLIGVAGLGGASDRKATLVLTAKENGTVPQEEFVCYGRIHGYLRLLAPVQGSHQLDSRWEDPTHKTVADSRSTVEFPAPGRSTAYIWFAFAEPPALGQLDPAVEEERRRYPGLWTVEVLWDGQPLVRQTFHVRCP